MGQRLFSCKIKEGGSTLGYRPLGYTFAKTGGAVNGGRSEVLPKSWTKVMRQSHFEFCIGQDLTHSIFL